MANPNRERGANYLRRLRRELDWAYSNLSNPFAEPPSKRAERLRAWYCNNGVRAFTTLYVIVLTVLNGENADDLFEELEQEPVRVMLGLGGRLGDEGTKLTGVRPGLEFKKVARLSAMVGWN